MQSDLVRQAEGGDVDAQFQLGLAYHEGKGVVQSHETAVLWYRKAAEKGSAEAQYALGVSYHEGYGVLCDDAEAVKWSRRAAEQGHMLAQHNLGACYHNGQGVSQDYREAARWHQKAAEQGDAASEYSLATMYDYGRGLSQDYPQAAEWYLKAAMQGHVMAQTNLAYLYAEGWGVRQDHAEAAKWYRVAAEAGHPEAQYNLGLHYLQGEGVTQEEVQAYMWVALAAAMGNVEAGELLETLASEMSPSNLDEARRRVQKHVSISGRSQWQSESVALTYRFSYDDIFQVKRQICRLEEAAYRRSERHFLYPVAAFLVLVGVAAASFSFGWGIGGDGIKIGSIILLLLTLGVAWFIHEHLTRPRTVFIQGERAEEDGRDFEGLHQLVATEHGLLWDHYFAEWSVFEKLRDTDEWVVFFMKNLVGYDMILNDPEQLLGIIVVPKRSVEEGDLKGFMQFLGERVAIEVA